MNQSGRTVYVLVGIFTVLGLTQLACGGGTLPQIDLPPDLPTATPTETPNPNVLPTPTPTVLPSPTMATTAPPTASATPQPTASNTPGPSPTARPPIVSGFHATFVQELKTTEYAVTASDPAGGKLTYAWTNSNKCGQFTGDNNSIAEWYHPDVPGGCPAEAVHPGVITVVVSNAAGSVTCEYSGGSADGTTVQCTSSTKP